MTQYFSVLNFFLLLKSNVTVATNDNTGNSSLLHKTTNRLNSTGSEYNGITRRRDSTVNTSQREDQFWTTKLNELEVLLNRLFSLLLTLLDLDIRSMG